jgi:HEAT repeat protein
MQKRTIFPTVISVLLAALAPVAFLAYDTEPRYNGQPLHRWIELLPSAEAENAIQHIHTKAIPFLLRWLAHEWQPSKSKELIARIAPKIPVVRDLPQLREWLYARDPLQFRGSAAAAAFKALGPSAWSALPGLIQIATSSSAPGPAHRAVDALVNIGPFALPALLTIIANQNAQARFYALTSIQQLGADAAPATPTLISCLTDRAVSIAAYEVLGRLKLEPHRVVPVLVNIAQGSDPLSRALAILTLGDYRKEAQGAVPTLLAALSDDHAVVRDAATNALQQIAPDLLTNSPPQ